MEVIERITVLIVSVLIVYTILAFILLELGIRDEIKQKKESQDRYRDDR